MSILWLFAGRQISEFADRIKMAEIESKPLRSISYEGTGEGGTLVIDNVRFGLAPLNPHVGTSKENLLAIANGGKVFAFGPPRSPDSLSADLPSGDNASLVMRQSCFPRLNFETSPPRLVRNSYRELTWNKASGEKLEMQWAVDVENNPTRLIRIEISGASR